MIFLITFILLLLGFQSQSQVSKKDKSYLKLEHCDLDRSRGLGMDTLLLLNGFHPDFLERKAKKRYKWFDYQVFEKDNCNNYQILLKNKLYHYFYVNQYTYDTLFLDIDIRKDTSINLNELSANYYTKTPSESLLLKDIKVGDKISFAYNYFDCPQYTPLYEITFKIINSKQCIILNPKKPLMPKSSIINIEDVLSFEKKIRTLKKGTGLQLQIRKNNRYQVFNCYLKDPTQLPSFLKTFENN